MIYFGKKLPTKLNIENSVFVDLGRKVESNNFDDFSQLQNPNKRSN